MTPHASQPDGTCARQEAPCIETRWNAGPHRLPPPRLDISQRRRPRSSPRDRARRSPPWGAPAHSSRKKGGTRIATASDRRRDDGGALYQTKAGSRRVSTLMGARSGCGKFGEAARGAESAEERVPRPAPRRRRRHLPPAIGSSARTRRGPTRSRDPRGDQYPQTQKRGGPRGNIPRGPPLRRSAVHRSAAPCSPTGFPRSTIGAGRLSFRVRNGTGRAPAARTADRWAALRPGGARVPLRAAQRVAGAVRASGAIRVKS